MYLEVVGTSENKSRYQIVKIAVAVILGACLLFKYLAIGLFLGSVFSLLI